MASIKLENVYKNFGKTPALKNLNIEIFNGEFFVLLGPTGAGKTTIIKLLLRFYDPLNGQIKVGNQDIKILNRGCIPLSIGSADIFTPSEFNLVTKSG